MFEGEGGADAAVSCEHSATVVEDRYMVVAGGHTTVSPVLNVIDTR